MPSTSPLAKDHRLDRDGLADIHFLTQKWQVARAAMGGEIPPYENIMLGNLGDLSDHIILIDCANDVCSIVRAGRRVPKWLGRDVVSAAIASLEPDCALALSTAVECALLSQNPHLSQTHCARDGLVQKYELLAMPLANRWGPPFVAIFVREYGIRYSLVDAIFRSTEHGVVALAAIRDGAGSPIDFQVVDLNDGAAKLLQKDIGELRWRRLAEGNHAFNTPNFLTSLKKLLQGSEVANFELRLPRGDGDLCLSVSLTAMGDLVCAVLTDVTELNRREQSSRLLFENNPMPMWIFDSETRYFMSANDAAIREYGYPH